jgi:hypothetical protein
MFKCGLCNGDSKPREKSERVILETHRIKYPVGQGWGITKEVLAHPACAAKLPRKGEID